MILLLLLLLDRNNGGVCLEGERRGQRRAGGII